MTDFEKNIAIAYLQQDEDSENKCVLTSQRLVVIHRGKVSSFERHHIKDLEFGKRRIMLPLVSGGIMAPLSLLAIFLNLYNPWPLMFVFFLGLALLYLGWQQHPVLTVKDSVKEHDFFLQEVTPNLQAFVSFARQVIFRGESFLYYVLPLDEWERIEKKEVAVESLSLKENNFIRLMNKQQLSRWRRQKLVALEAYVILHIDPLKVSGNIRYETTERGSPELYAHLYGPIDREAIVKTEIN